MNTRTRCVLLFGAALFAVGSCGGDDEPSTGNDPDGEVAEAGEEGDDPGSDEAFDPSDVDACALLDVGTVQELTGRTSDEFESQGGASRCFWGATQPGIPSYVEIAISRAGEAGPVSPVGGCAGSSVAGVGEQALGGTCTDTHKKVFLVAKEGGAQVSVLVNDPQGPLTPQDLKAVVGEALGAL